MESSYPLVPISSIHNDQVVNDDLNDLWDTTLKPFHQFEGIVDNSPCSEQTLLPSFFAIESTEYEQPDASSFKHEALDMESLLPSQLPNDSLEPMAFNPQNMTHVLNHFPELHPMDGSFLRSAFENLDGLPNTHSPRGTLPSMTHDSPTAATIYPTALSAISLVGHLSPHMKSHHMPDSPPTSATGLCQVPQCGRRIRSKGFCKAHGGGRKCTLPGCNKSAQNGEFCIGHGGGKQCAHLGCPKAAQSHGLCKAHGGGARCKHQHCMKSSQGGGYCRAHGGGKRCQAEHCTKGAQRGNFCATHGGFRNCQIDGCVRTDRGGGYCEVHRRDKLCTVTGCKKLSKTNGLCTVHLRRVDKEVKKQAKNHQAIANAGQAAQQCVMLPVGMVFSV
ncbi:hypothetical protein DYB28_000599 [Aphanomyces astaci]|uniref:WRKY19-like zinc finger domain-containing protein n=1 Tax=Aphanomyces astaci TaxID=112090 RepID=A0A9X8HAD4_APHAT|nr:hypothetical protein DYB28_000599 [Aphanomyces astaci]